MSAPPRPTLSPDLDELAAAFYRECAKGRLVFQRCSACRTWRHLPRWVCAACGSPDWDWQPSSGRGRIHTWTVTHRALHPTLVPEVPYAVVIVEMQEGVRLVSRVLGLEPERLALDLPVVAELVPAGEGMAVPFFRPA